MKTYKKQLPVGYAFMKWMQRSSCWGNPRHALNFQNIRDFMCNRCETSITTRTTSLTYVTFLSVHFFWYLLFTYVVSFYFRCILCTLQRQERIFDPSFICDFRSPGCTLPLLQVCNPGTEQLCITNMFSLLGEY